MIDRAPANITNNTQQLLGSPRDFMLSSEEATYPFMAL
jgi:hypothetical protein